MQEKVEQLGNKSLKLTDDFYVGLGYIAKHAKKISAAMPDYLEKWFVKEFGDVERRVVDQTKLTSGGYTMQWALSLKIDLDTNDNIPRSLIRYLSKERKDIKAIADTEFVFGLMKSTGLQFGKVQDLDAIMNNIPADKLDNFKLGFTI